MHWDVFGWDYRLTRLVRHATRRGQTRKMKSVSCTPPRHASQGVPQGVGLTGTDRRHSTRPRDMPLKACLKAWHSPVAEAERYTPQQHASQGVLQGV